MITYRDLLEYLKLQKNQDAVLFSRGFGGASINRPRLSFRCSRINYYANGKAAEETDKDLGITVGIDNTTNVHIFPVVRLVRWLGPGDNNKYGAMKATCAAWVEMLEMLPNSMLDHELMLVDESSRNVAVNPLYGGLRVGPIDSTRFIYRCVDENLEAYELIFDSRNRRGLSWCMDYLVNNMTPSGRNQYQVSPDWTEPNNYPFIVIDGVKRNNGRYYLTNNYDSEGLIVE